MLRLGCRESRRQGAEASTNAGSEVILALCQASESVHALKIFDDMMPSSDPDAATQAEVSIIVDPLRQALTYCLEQKCRSSGSALHRGSECMNAVCLLCVDQIPVGLHADIRHAFMPMVQR